MEFTYLSGVANIRSLEFKSYVSSYPDYATVNEKLQVPLAYQEKFGKVTSPLDNPNLLKDVGLEEISLEMNNIDRLYHLNHYEDKNYSDNLDILFRQDRAGQKIFTEMTVSYNENDNDEFQGDGMIYMTKYPTFFLNNSETTDQTREQIRSALASDGYRVSVEETHEYMQGNPSYGNSVQHLQFLAHNAIYDNRNKLKHFKKMLPRQLSNSVDGFIGIKNGLM